MSRSFAYPPVSRLFILLSLAALFFPRFGPQSPAHPLVAQPSAASSIGGCPLFPADNIWNRDITDLPSDPNSPYLASIGLDTGLHPDFGSGLYDGEPIGIPYEVVPSNQPLLPITFDYSDESDPGPYPIPLTAPIEGGANGSGDRHILTVQSGSCKLYETYDTNPDGNGGWTAGSGAVWDLNSNALRPDNWTSADAAGLPMLPGLVRYDEVAAGAINHAIRFTVQHTQQAHIWPARHDASSNTDSALPPMGLRVRLKASVDISSYPPDVQVILTALKHYGMIVADNGSSWYISGTQDDRWNNDTLHTLDGIKGSDFEVVDESSLMIDPNSAQSRPPASTPGSMFFPETGHTVKGKFLAYWQQHGGLAQQGYPISEERQEVSDLDGKTYTVQYFERAEFELHPENQPPNDVLLSQLGTLRYRQKYPRGATNQQVNPDNPYRFAQTGHSIGGKFRAYWESHGGLAQQGYPISDEFQEKSDLDGKTYTVQYFERAVFELHPQNQPPYDVLLSQLGTFQYQRKYPN